jgi:hypothetical protein
MASVAARRVTATPGELPTCRIVDSIPETGSCQHWPARRWPPPAFPSGTRCSRDASPALHRDPDPGLEVLLGELERYVTNRSVPAGHLGFAVPLELSTPYGPVRLISTLTTFVTATDVLLSELRMEAFLPADDSTAERLRQRAAETTASGRSELTPERAVL